MSLTTQDTLFKGRKTDTTFKRGQPNAGVSDNKRKVIKVNVNPSDAMPTAGSINNIQLSVFFDASFLENLIMRVPLDRIVDDSKTMARVRV